MVNIYVGNLSYRAIEDDLRRVFSAHGDVARVSIVRRGPRRKSRGFGFVEMGDEQSAKAAIGATQRREIHGRAIVVAPAESRLTGAYLMDVQDDFNDTAR